MTKHAAFVVVVMLLLAGIGSAAVARRAMAPSKQVAAAIEYEKSLGPRPTPRWYWRWTQWRLGEGFARGHAHERDLRPKRAPNRVPRWAWRRLHFFLLARRKRTLAHPGKHTARTGHGTQTTTGTTATTPPRPAGGTGIGVLSYGGNLTNVANPNLYSMVIGSASSKDATSVVAVAAGRGLVYFNGTVVQTSYSTGVTYAQASSNGWLLKCGTGYCVNSTYGSYGADLGSSAYQQAWISNVLGYLSAHPGVDGVFIDSVLYDPQATFGTYPTKYPSTSAWSAATVSFVKAVYAALHAHGYYVALNAGAYKAGDSSYTDGTSTINWWKEVAPYADGLMDEYYAEASKDRLRANGTASYQRWDGWQRLIPTAQGLGKDFIGLTYQSCTDTAAMTYGKASFLLEWNGGGSVFIYNCGSSDPTNTGWATSIGDPAGAKVQVGIGWERAYTGGTVLVNPSPTVSQTFTVNGTSYTLPATTARVLAGS